jgi:hypothetical protein
MPAPDAIDIVVLPFPRMMIWYAILMGLLIRYGIGGFGPPRPPRPVAQKGKR